MELRVGGESGARQRGCARGRGSACVCLDVSTRRGRKCVSVNVYGHHTCVHVCMEKWACDLSTHLPVGVHVCVSVSVSLCV